MPLEQLGTALTALAFFVASKVGKAGLTVTVDVWEIVDTTTKTEIVTGAAAVEIGDGVYGYTLPGASVNAEALYLFVFKTTDGTVDQQHIASLWAVGKGGLEHLVGGGSIQVTSPVLDGGQVHVVRGDDYTVAGGTALTWTGSFTRDPTAAASITLTVSLNGAVVFTSTVEAVSATSIRAELASADTASLEPPAAFPRNVGVVAIYDYDIQATFGTEKHTLLRKARGFTLLEDYTP